tara:strand:- start:14241 stop:14717 length:477 start_codon:yes stop_codon:yes gene_type:complete
MGFEIKTSSGHTIKSNSAALEIFEDGLDDLLRPLEIEMKMALVPILNNTKKNWPYNHRRSRSIANKPHSRDMFFIQSKKVITGGNIGLKVSINNNAQYVFMIRTSKEFLSETKDNRLVPLGQGQHAFSKLLFDPMKKQAQNVAEKMANEYLKIVRRVA